MKRYLRAAAVAVSAAVVTLPGFAADTAVSVSIGQPGFYGRIDIGGYPPPPLIYPEPIWIERLPMERPPIYLRVPPGHAKHWRKHCRKYNACGERVFFVQDSWYTHEYVPRYQERRHERWDERRDERWDERRDGRRDEHRREEGRGRHGGDHGHDRGHAHER